MFLRWRGFFFSILIAKRHGEIVDAQPLRTRTKLLCCLNAQNVIIAQSNRCDIREYYYYYYITNFLFRIRRFIIFEIPCISNSCSLSWYSQHSRTARYPFFFLNVFRPLRRYSFQAVIYRYIYFYFFFAIIIILYSPCIVYTALRTTWWEYVSAVILISRGTAEMYRRHLNVTKLQ